MFIRVCLKVPCVRANGRGAEFGPTVFMHSGVVGWVSGTVGLDWIFGVFPGPDRGTSCVCDTLIC